MVMTGKKLVLSLVLVLMTVFMMQVVSALDLNGSVSGVFAGENHPTKADYTQLSAFTGKFYVLNATYVFNLTLQNFNNTHNVTSVSIKLPPGFTFVANSNRTNASATEFNNLVQGSQAVIYLNSTNVNISPVISIVGPIIYLQFNATLNSTVTQGNLNITIAGHASNASVGNLTIANVGLI